MFYTHLTTLNMRTEIAKWANIYALLCKNVMSFLSSAAAKGSYTVQVDTSPREHHPL
jgi:hypothetical protein